MYRKLSTSPHEVSLYFSKSHFRFSANTTKPVVNNQPSKAGMAAGGEEREMVRGGADKSAMARSEAQSDSSRAGIKRPQDNLSKDTPPSARPRGHKKAAHQRDQIEGEPQRTLCSRTRSRRTLTLSGIECRAILCRTIARSATVSRPRQVKREDASAGSWRNKIKRKRRTTAQSERS